MKTAIRVIAAFSVFVAAVSCMKDGEMLTVSLPDENIGFSVDRAEIDLGVMSDTDLALTLMWNPDAVTPQVSNPDVAMADNMVSLMLQMSIDENFSSPYEASLDAAAGVQQFTVSEFSPMVLRLGISERSVVYMRLAVSLADNTEPIYSNTVSVTVVPLNVDMSVMTIVSNMTANAGETIATLYSTDANPGRYEGFVVFSQGWYNFYADQADGTRWGNDGEVGTPYMISDDAATQWNCWSAEPSGCMYVYVDTDQRQWWQVYLPSVTISGGAADADMRFSTGSGLWTGTFTTTDANSTVTFSGTGRQYDITTGTDAGVVPSAEIPFGLTLNADNTFTYVENGTAAGYNVAETGTYTITIDVLNGTWSIETGGSDPVDYPEYVSAYYYLKEGTDQLTLACKLAPASEDGVYEGFVYTDPAWSSNYSNFRFVSSDDEVYGTEDQYNLSSLGGNIWSSNPGMNYVTVDLTTMTWSEVPATAIRITGNFNSWALTDALEFNPETGKWETDITMSEVYNAETGYNDWPNFKFVIDRAASEDAWEWQYSDPDGDGTLELGITTERAVEAGNYHIEVDFNDFLYPTYTITSND